MSHNTAPALIESSTFAIPESAAPTWSVESDIGIGTGDGPHSLDVMYLGAAHPIHGTEFELKLTQIIRMTVGEVTVNPTVITLATDDALIDVSASQARQLARELLSIADQLEQLQTEAAAR